MAASQPHHLSANGGIFHLEDFGVKESWYVSLGNSKHEISGDFVGVMTSHDNRRDNHLFIWNWNTGFLHVKMVRSLRKTFYREKGGYNKQKLIDRAANPSRALRRGAFLFP